jgi:sodium transport system ATP-binding protein
MPVALIASNLAKTYGQHAAIQDISFEAYTGEILGILGPNGAGKTTTMRILATLIRTDAGTASINGYDIQQEPAMVRRNIGVLTTDIGLYDRFTGRENLRYFGRLYGMSHQDIRARIGTLASLLHMEEFLDQKAGGYSTGMKQRVAVARAIIHDPAVMILDEPTTGLDVLASQTVLDFMQLAKQQQKCVIFSTHNMLDAERLCDRIAIMYQGRLNTVDVPKALMQQTHSQNLADAFLTTIGKEPRKN